MKEAMVTRTFKTYDVTVLGVNKETAEVYNRTVTLFRITGTEEKDLKLVSKEIDDPNFKPVSVVNVDTVTEIIGMPLTDFYKNGIKTERPESQMKHVNKEA